MAQRPLPNAKKLRASSMEARRPRMSHSLPYAAQKAHTERRYEVPSHEAFSEAEKDEEIGARRVVTSTPSMADRIREEKRASIVGMSTDLGTRGASASGGARSSAAALTDVDPYWRAASPSARSDARSSRSESLISDNVASRIRFG